ncbi:peptidase S10, serine carboxypeptidase [Blastocladiella britannica]|nr:peptidase S10, serine carboxypeptidase [Blastocladiella britannica]
MYFWLVLGETRPANSTEKLVIWLNGGPGCSSLEGMVLENGPLLVSENGKLHANEHSWHKRANVLYIDQPIGTGYSFSKLRQKTTTQVQMAEQFTNFLVKFFAVFPNLQESDIYLAGESFAGTYIPYIAQAILVHNSFQPIVTANSSMIPWSLKGMMIGNGWIDPVNQYRSYIDFGVKHNLLSGGFLTTAEEDWVGCRSAMEKNGVRIHVPECESISNQVTEQSKVNHGGLCMNVYDIRLRDESFGDGCGAAWPSTLMGAYRFFGDQTLLDYTHAQGSVNQWVECSSSVFDAMKKDSSLPSITLLPDLVKKVPLFLYSGDQDFICNHQGTSSLFSLCH